MQRLSGPPASRWTNQPERHPGRGTMAQRTQSRWPFRLLAPCARLHRDRPGPCRRSNLARPDDPEDWYHPRMQDQAAPWL